jgi:hypothetical protein
MKNKYLEDINDYVFINIEPASYIYFISWTPFKHKSWHDRVKIGVSKNPEKRLMQLQTAHPDELKIWHVFKVPADDSKKIENRLHRKFKWSRKRGEWFVIHRAVRIWIKEHKKMIDKANLSASRKFILRKKKSVDP